MNYVESFPSFALLSARVRHLANYPGHSRVNRLVRMSGHWIINYTLGE